jgi:hypothetical protein
MSKSNTRELERANAVDEAVGRLNAALRLVKDHDCTRDAYADARENTGGYDVGMIQDTLEGIRNRLHAVANGEVQ